MTMMTETDINRNNADADLYYAELNGEFIASFEGNSDDYLDTLHAEFVAVHGPNAAADMIEAVECFPCTPKLEDEPTASDLPW